MIFTLCFAMLIAKFKHYKISCLFKTWTIYPALFVDVFYVIFQVNIFVGNYSVVQYAAFVRYSFLLAFLIPLFVYKLYKSALIGSASILAGTLLNNFVIAQNGGKMPVFPYLSHLTGYIKTEKLLILQDIHVLGNAHTKWIFLTDIFDVGFSILSVGDLFIHFYVFIMVYSLIVALNRQQSSIVF